MAGNHHDIEKKLWEAADALRANSELGPAEYSVPVLGLIFLRYADHKFTHVEKELAGKSTGRRKVGKVDYQARGVMYLPEEARFSNLLRLPEPPMVSIFTRVGPKEMRDFFTCDALSAGKVSRNEQETGADSGSVG